MGRFFKVINPNPPRTRSFLKKKNPNPTQDLKNPSQTRPVKIGPGRKPTGLDFIATLRISAITRLCKKRVLI